MTTVIPQSRTVSCDCCTKEISVSMPHYSLSIPLEKRKETLPSPTRGGVTLTVYCFQWVWDCKEIDFCSPECMKKWMRSDEFVKTHAHFEPARADEGITLNDAFIATDGTLLFNSTEGTLTTQPG